MSARLANTLIGESNARRYFRLLSAALTATLCVACTTGKACDRGFMVRNGWQLSWQQHMLPLTVGSDGHGNREHLEAIMRAAADINALTGVYIFSLYEGHTGQFNVASSMSIPSGSVLAGETTVEFRSQGHIFQTAISLREDLRGDELYYVAVHEMGHALGLDHDTCDESIMTTPMLIGYPYSLEQGDIDRLRRIYGGGHDVR